MPRPKKGHRKDGRVQIKRVIGHDYDGRPINKWFSGKTKAEAERHYQEFLHEWEKAEAEKKHTPFEKWLDTWLYTYKEPDIKESTFVSTYKRTCEKHILPYFKGKTLQEINQAQIKAFLNTTRDKSQSAIDKIIICLNGIFETAIDNDLISKNPCRNLSAKSKKEHAKKRTYDKETAEHLCCIDHKFAILPHMLIRLGFRASELCGLKKESIDLTEKILYIKEGVTSESGKVFIGKPKSANSVRKLPIPDDLISRIEDAIPNSNSEYLLSDEKGNPLTPSVIYHRIKILFNYLKIPKDKQLSTHELRHTCGTLLYNETKDIYYVSRFLGHSDVGITTKIYIHSNLQEDAVHIDFDELK